MISRVYSPDIYNVRCSFVCIGMIHFNLTSAIRLAVLPLQTSIYMYQLFAYIGNIVFLAKNLQDRPDGDV